MLTSRAEPWRLQIESIVSADDAGGVRPALWMSGVRLLVRAEDAERATEILRSK